ncbi:MAG: hypothetical protein ABI168_00590 [Ginsengibacter sp.]
MKKKIPLFILMQIISLLSYSQKDSTDKYLLDSLLKNDQMLKLINELGNEKSYFKANISISNSPFSNRSKTLKYVQSENRLLFNPSVGYFHKSGLGLSLNMYASQKMNGFGFFEAGIIPSYAISLGSFDFLASYSHQFSFKKYEPVNFPFQNEWSLTAANNGGWINPSITAGYSSGHSYEIIRIDTSFISGGQNIKIKYIDSVNTRLTSFQLIAALTHSFDFGNIFSSSDYISFTPQFLLGAGINNYDVSHKSSANYFNSFTKKRLKRKRQYLNPSYNSMFEIQTLALDLDITYSYKKFYIEPEIYLEYYLLQTDEKKLTPLLNLTAGFIF